jgi:hypothetical protein
LFYGFEMEEAEERKDPESLRERVEEERESSWA